MGTRETMQATYQVSGERGTVKSTDLGSLRKVREYLYHPDDIKLLKIGQIIKSGKRLLGGKEKKVPMSKVIDYLNMDINHIAKMAMLEKKINNDRRM